MSMENKKTGMAPLPIADQEVDFRDNPAGQQLMKDTEIDFLKGKNAVLARALATSIEQCKNCAAELNTQVEELTRQVKNVRLSANAIDLEVKRHNESMLSQWKSQAERMLENLETKIAEVKELSTQIQETVVTATEKAIDSASKTLDSGLEKSMGKTIAKLESYTNEISKRIEKTDCELTKVSRQIYYESGVRKFFFWMRPVLMFAEAICMIILLVR